MEIKTRNIFLTGPPSSGKTTVIKKVLVGLTKRATGFYTEEIKRHDRRVGFLMKTLDGREGLLGHEDITSRFQIRRYGVSIEHIEAIAVPSITSQAEDEVIIVDEIGKMECFSEKFCEAARKALDASNVVLGTIAVGGTDFIREIKQRKDITLLEVTLQNRETLPHTIVKNLEELFDR